MMCTEYFCLAEVCREDVALLKCSVVHEELAMLLHTHYMTVHCGQTVSQLGIVQLTHCIGLVSDSWVL